MTQLIVHDNAQAFYTLLLRELGHSEVLHNVIFGVTARWMAKGTKDDANLFMSYTQNGKTAFVTVVDNMLAVSYGFDAQGIKALSIFLKERHIKPKSIQADAPTAALFLEAWRDVGRGEIELELRAMSCQQVKPPQNIKGQGRYAAGQDFEPVKALAMGFVSELFPNTFNEAKETAKIIQRLAEGRYYLWEDQGQAVSLCMRTRDLPHGCALSYVYTPPALRGRGYASAVVAGMTTDCMARGCAYVCLFTDSSNPTSNKVYENIGYQEVGHLMQYHLRYEEKA